jgi:glycosyltransferase involved in cell wall biosynthesis
VRRILHIYSGNFFGGIEQMLLTFAGADGLHGLTHEFALCFEGALSQRLKTHAATVENIGPVRMRRPDTVYRARSHVRRILRERHIDCVICHSSWALALFGPVVKRAGVPLIFWVHDRLQERGFVDRLASRIKPDLAVCNSAYSEQSVAALYSDLPSAVIHCPSPASAPMPDAERLELRSRLGAEARTVVILIAARFEHWKGHELLIRALSRISDLQNWTCWILGEQQSGQQSSLVARMKSAAMIGEVADRICFLGHQENARQYFEAADIYCQPNTTPEPFGLTFVEALQAGLPIVTTSLGGGADEFLDSGAAVFVRQSDDAGLATVLRDLIRSPEKRAHYAAEGKRRAIEIADVESQLGKVRVAVDAVVSLNRAQF